MSKDNDPRLTHWSPPDGIINSGYGRITNREWCEREMARINRRGDNVSIVTNADGMIALTR